MKFGACHPDDIYIYALIRSTKMNVIWILIVFILCQLIVAFWFDIYVYVDLAASN